MAFVTEQDVVGDGVAGYWTSLDGAGPWVITVQLLPGSHIRPLLNVNHFLVRMIDTQITLT